MSIASYLANLIYPVPSRQIEKLDDELAGVLAENVDLGNQVAQLRSANNNLIDKLAHAANNIASLRDQRERLRNELMVARQYVLDASNQIDDELDTLGPRSKKRVALQATLAAVNADLKSIADTLVETSK